MILVFTSRVVFVYQIYIKQNAYFGVNIQEVVTMKKKIFRVIAVVLVMGTLMGTLTACGGGESYNDWHNKQVQKGVENARKIYKGY